MHLQLLTLVCHAQPPRTVVIKYKILVGECLSVDALASGAIVVNNVTTCFRAKWNMFIIIHCCITDKWRKKTRGNLLTQVYIENGH